MAIKHGKWVCPKTNTAMFVTCRQSLRAPSGMVLPRQNLLKNCRWRHGCNEWIWIMNMDHIWIMNMDHVDHEYGSIIFLIKKNPFMRSYPAKPCRSGGCSCTFSRPNKVQDHQNFAGKLIGHRAKLTIPGPPNPIGTLIEETHTAKKLIASGGAAVTLHLPSFDLGSDFCGFQSGKPNTEPPVGAWFLPRISGQIGYPLLLGLPHHMQCRFHLYLGLSNAPATQNESFHLNSLVAWFIFRE